MRKFSALFNARTLTGLSCLVSLILAAGFSCAPKEAIRKPVFKRDYGEEAPSAAPHGRHVVKRGETLYSISRRYGVSVSSIIKANDIKDVKDIKVGTRLVIPDERVGGPAPERRRRKTAGEKGRPAPVATDVRFIWPLKSFTVTTGFGALSSRKHDGLDLAAPRGTPIMAAAGGRVIFSGQGPSGYGKIVIIKHDTRTITVYAHNEKNLAREGQAVSRGETIATVGRSGRANGYHLHFELRIDRKPVDPRRHLPGL